MARSRAERLALVALHRAAAEALEARLKREALDLFEQEQSADTWKLPDGQVITATTNNRQDVVDREALLDHLEAHTAAVTRREVREVPDGFLKSYLASLSPVVEREDGTVRLASTKERKEPGATFPACDPNGVIVPGVRWTAGGLLYSVSIKLDPARREYLASHAMDYASGESTWAEMVEDADTDHEALAADQDPPMTLELPDMQVQRGGIRFE
jgi:hypothetical protein